MNKVWRRAEAHIKRIDELEAENAKLREACETCERAITLLVEVEQPTLTDWTNLRFARHLSRKALAETGPKPAEAAGG